MYSCTRIQRSHWSGRSPAPAGRSTERARKSVGARIRDALDRIEHVHPLLAGHLRLNLRTGTTCGYVPTEERRCTSEPGRCHPRRRRFLSNLAGAHHPPRRLVVPGCECAILQAARGQLEVPPQPTIRDLLADRARRGFVGRERELALLDTLLVTMARWCCTSAVRPASASLDFWTCSRLVREPAAPRSCVWTGTPSSQRKLAFATRSRRRLVGGPIPGPGRWPRRSRHRRVRRPAAARHLAAAGVRAVVARNDPGPDGQSRAARRPVDVRA